MPRLTLSEILLRSSVGDVLYTEMKDTMVGSYAHRAGVKVSTERLLAIHPSKREVIDLTRVTVLSKGEPRFVKKGREARVHRTR